MYLTHQKHVTLWIQKNIIFSIKKHIFNNPWKALFRFQLFSYIHSFNDKSRMKKLALWAKQKIQINFIFWSRVKKCFTILVYLGVISKFCRCGTKVDPSLVLPFWWMSCLNWSLTFMMQLFIFSLLALSPPPTQIFILVSTTLLSSFSTSYHNSFVALYAFPSIFTLSFNMFVLKLSLAWYKHFNKR